MLQWQWLSGHWPQPRWSHDHHDRIHQLRSNEDISRPEELGGHPILENLPKVGTVKDAIIPYDE